MGRKTYFGVPEDKRPLKDRINVVLTTNPAGYTFPENVLVFSSLDKALGYFETEEMQVKIENVWIVGGSSVYKEAMDSDRCHRIYITNIFGEFDCDTFFPEMDTNVFKMIANDSDIPEAIQEENGLQYQYQIYEKTKKWNFYCHFN